MPSDYWGYSKGETTPIAAMRIWYALMYRVRARASSRKHRVKLMPTLELIPTKRDVYHNLVPE